MISNTMFRKVASSARCRGVNVQYMNVKYRSVSRSLQKLKAADSSPPENPTPEPKTPEPTPDPEAPPAQEAEQASLTPPSSPPPLKVQGSDPKTFQIPEGQTMNVLSAAPGLLLRPGIGVFSPGYSPGIGAKPEGGYSLLELGGQALVEKNSTSDKCKEPLIVYEFEACPFCKKVREAINCLDLDMLVYPCPKDGDVHRPVAIEKGGKTQFPYLIDPNNDNKAMYESSDIIEYLFQEYGDGNVPLLLREGAFGTALAVASNAFRNDKGRTARPSTQPEQPLTLWGYEPSPFVKFVREALCELQTPYIMKSTSRGSNKRTELLQKWGTFQVPCIEDPNTGVVMYESTDIVDYLNKTYGK